MYHCRLYLCYDSAAGLTTELISNPWIARKSWATRTGIHVFSLGWTISGEECNGKQRHFPHWVGTKLMKSLSCATPLQAGAFLACLHVLAHILLKESTTDLFLGWGEAGRALSGAERVWSSAHFWVCRQPSQHIAPGGFRKTFVSSPTLWADRMRCMENQEPKNQNHTSWHRMAVVITPHRLEACLLQWRGYTEQEKVWKPRRTLASF